MGNKSSVQSGIIFKHGERYYLMNTYGNVYNQEGQLVLYREMYNRWIYIPGDSSWYPKTVDLELYFGVIDRSSFDGTTFKLLDTTFRMGRNFDSIQVRKKDTPKEEESIVILYEDNKWVLKEGSNHPRFDLNSLVLSGEMGTVKTSKNLRENIIENATTVVKILERERSVTELKYWTSLDKIYFTIGGFTHIFVMTANGVVHTLEDETPEGDMKYFKLYAFPFKEHGKTVWKKLDRSNHYVSVKDRLNVIFRGLFSERFE